MGQVKVTVAFTSIFTWYSRHYYYDIGTPGGFGQGHLVGHIGDALVEVGDWRVDVHLDGPLILLLLCFLCGLLCGWLDVHLKQQLPWDLPTGLILSLWLSLWMTWHPRPPETTASMRSAHWSYFVFVAFFVDDLTSTWNNSLHEICPLVLILCGRLRGWLNRHLKQQPPWDLSPVPILSLGCLRAWLNGHLKQQLPWHLPTVLILSVGIFMEDWTSTWNNIHHETCPLLILCLWASLWVTECSPETISTLSSAPCSSSVFVGVSVDDWTSRSSAQ